MSACLLHTKYDRELGSGTETDEIDVWSKGAGLRDFKKERGKNSITLR